MPRRLAPNLENCSLVELEIAAHAAPSRRSHNRLMAIRALAWNIVPEQVAALYSVSPRSLTNWIRRFNQQGIDGLGRPPKITPEQSVHYRQLIEQPEIAEQLHWTADRGRSPELPPFPGQSVPAAAPHRGLLPVLAAAPPPPGHGTGHGSGQYLAPQALEDRGPHPGDQPPHLGAPGLGLSLPRPLGRAAAKPPGQSRLIPLPPAVVLNPGGEVRPKSALRPSLVGFLPGNTTLRLFSVFFQPPSHLYTSIKPLENGLLTAFVNKASSRV